MQFKHPELLWALFLLLIPILIHLFQLRRFQKTPFTNVKFLQRVVSESRKSNRLKKWLLLCTRLLLLGAFILAFAQPFFAEETALRKQETVIYLDNSFSMQAKTNGGSLLSDAVQELLRSIPEDNEFSLFTNDQVFRKVSLKTVQNELLSLSHSSKQLQLSEIYLKASTLFEPSENASRNLVIISDFQQRMFGVGTDSLSNSTLDYHLVQVGPPQIDNVAIDSAYISGQTSENLELTALFSSHHDIESIPVSLFNDEILIAKTSVAFNGQKQGAVTFSLPKNEAIKGKILISDAALAYDNTLYFNIDTKEKIKVLSIGPASTDFLGRIYTPDEFQFESRSLKNLNYGSIEDQNLIILNELESVPNALTTSIEAFKDKDGHLLVIPGPTINPDTYRNLLFDSFSTTYGETVYGEQRINDISFSHPIYQNVFEKKVANFQYPTVPQYYRVRTRAPHLLSFQDKNPFLFGLDNFFAFTSALSPENGNFKSSPLIVPTLYNIGVNSLKLPRLYYPLNQESIIDVPVKLSKDQILKIKQGDYEFIPRQASFANKVSLSFLENPVEDGIYTLLNDRSELRRLSFNHPRAESELVYANPSRLAPTSTSESISDFFERQQKDRSIKELWKWFAILALIFMGTEILLQKYLK